MDLRAYERVKFELAEILNTLPRDAAQFQRRLDLFARLAEDRFNLVVVGRFSRGKSSLMNAILGMDRLPTGVVPLTSVITTVTYGSEERVTLHFRGSGLIEDIQLDQLADYVTERGNPGNARRIEVAEVQLPAPILRHGFHFVDTPGLGSSIAENSRATEAFMPEADALILVTSFDSPLSEEEIAVLRSARRLRRRVFLAVNKQDAVTAAEQAEVLAHVAGQVRSVFGADRQEVFPLSARNALTAKLAANRVGLAASGVPGLEQALIGFLVSGRRQEFLLAMCARVGEMVAPDAGAVARLDALRASIVTPGSRVIPAVQTEQELASDIPPCEVCVRIEIAIADFMMGYQARLGRDPAARTGTGRTPGPLRHACLAVRESCGAARGLRRVRPGAGVRRRRACAPRQRAKPRFCATQSSKCCRMRGIVRSVRLRQRREQRPPRWSPPAWPRRVRRRRRGFRQFACRISRQCWPP